MANEVLLVNPRRRRRATRKRRSPAQRAATRQLVARNRGRSGTARKKRRRRNPIGPYARNGMGMYVSNPRRRRRPTRKRATARRRYRRNPTTMKGIINVLVMPAATAGAGALALDILWGFVPVPQEIKTGPMRHVAKGLGAIVLGQLVGMVGTKRMGDTMAMGALTVVFHSAFREMTAQFMPNVNLGYYSAGANAGYDPQLGYYVASPRMTVARGESVPAANSELGYYTQEGVGAQY